MLEGKNWSQSYYFATPKPGSSLALYQHFNHLISYDESTTILTVGHRSVTASESKTSQITISNSCALCEWLTRRYEPHPCCVPEDTMFFLQVWYIAARRRCKTSENCRRTQGHTHTHRRSGHTHTQHTPSTDGLRYARRVIQLPCTLLKHVPFSIGHFTSICMIKKTKVCDIIAFAISIYIWRLKCRLGARFYVTSAGFFKYLPNSKVPFGSM